MSNSKRKCIHCREYAQAESGILTPVGFFCSLEHAINHAQKKRDADTRARKKAELEKSKEVRRRKKEFYDNDRSHQLKLAQANFNRYIRLRDSGEPCISCGKPDNGEHQRHASHYRSVGACSSLRFSEINVWASCSVCNNYLSGNIGNYRAALIKKIGIDAVEWIEAQPKTKTYKIDEIIAIKNKYAKLARACR